MQSQLKNIILASSVILLAFSCFAFFWLLGKIENNNAVADKSQTEWQAEATRRSEAKTLDRTMKALTQERAMLDTHFAKGSNIVPFLDTLEGLASQVGIKAEVTSVDIPKDEVALVVMLRATGSFGSVYKFLKLLENSAYELELDSVNLQTAPGQELPEGVVPEWNATFKVRLLSFVP